MAKKDETLRKQLSAVLQKHSGDSEAATTPDRILANFLTTTLIAYDVAGFCSDAVLPDGEEQPPPELAKLRRDSVIVEILKWTAAVEIDKDITGHQAIALADAILAAAEPAEPAEAAEATED